MKIESSAFVSGGSIPPEHTCDGKQISPPLFWSESPERTESFVLLVDDPDAVAVIGKTFDHWVLYDLPGDLRELPPGLSTAPKLAGGGVHGITTQGTYGYFGPCPPPGSSPHHYFFRLFALDRRLNLEPGQTKAEILRAMEGYVLDRAELIGLYAR
ncbi:YbhB/YbcL family Raf kinase inhibitor-like protein [Pannus brasiliensis CCIBt3594]|uniref:YbhB/YbcL family Raf kinase inhibitor-like protein n=1 Tax=Pannus brasiliensis CCIBt3594 TaxID=1427578 RepID=A0AAW9QKS1_9CHRO